MKIPPISAGVDSASPPSLKREPSAPLYFPSAIQSTSTPNSFLSRFITNITAFFVMVLQFVGLINPSKPAKPIPETPSAKPTLGKIAEKTLEPQPDILPEGDPFRELIFDCKGNRKNQDVCDAVYKLYDILGTGLSQWISQKSLILEYKEKIVGRKPHPFEFLYFLFSNRTTTQNAVAFKKTTYPTLTFIKFLTGQDPWPEFMSKNSINLTRHQDSLLLLLPGFCKLLSFEGAQEKLAGFVKAQKWESFILALFEEREKASN